MRVAYVSTCGAGHLNTLRALWKKWPQQQRRLFLLRFADEPLPTPQLEEETSSRDVIVLTCNQNKPSENATVFNETRRQLLQPALHVWLHDYRPTLIVYDFFCLEARVLSRVLGVPAICSIPATLRPGEKETCSDALLVKEHFYWVWRDPYPVAIEPVAFLGQRRRKCFTTTRFFGHNAKIAVVTFGTVIPHYEGCKERLNQLMLQMERLVFRQKETTFIFAGIQGPAGRNTISYPDPEDCDLIDVFREAKPGLLIFHGGGNTYAEALAVRVPKILVCPFFGDQFETARQEGNVYSGGDLLEDVKKAKEHVYSEEATIEKRNPFDDRFPDYFRTGDLVFGHRRHRTALQKQFPQVNLHLEHYKPFADFAHPEVGELPAIADVYNDELGLLNSSSSSSNNPYQERLLDVALARSSICQTLVSLPHDHRLVHYCLEILKLTIGKWKGRIHFVLGPSHELGPATQMELDYIERNWKDVCDAVLFYNVWGERIPTPWSCPTKKKSESAVMPSPIPLKENAMVHGLCSIPGRMPLVWGREKSYSSTVEKLSHRHLPLLDHYGWRTGYLDKEDLQKLQRALLPCWSVSVCWCRQRVWFYYYTKEHTEVQIWPWIYLHHFYLEQEDMERQFKMQEEIEKL